MQKKNFDAKNSLMQKKKSLSKKFFMQKNFDAIKF